MDLDDVTLELRTREQVRVALTEFPLLGSDQERLTAAHRLIRRAGKEIGARVRTVHVRHLGAVFGLRGPRALAGRARGTLVSPANRMPINLISALLSRAGRAIQGHA
jgi:hypothetical protein